MSHSSEYPGEYEEGDELSSDDDYPREYPSPKEYKTGDELSSDDDYSGMTKELWDKYYKQVRESNGFDVDDTPPGSGTIKPISFNSCEEGLKEVKHCINLAIDDYKKKHNKNLQLEEINKVNSHLGTMSLYITFQAKDTSTGNSATYQTEVYSPVNVEKCKVYVMRRKPGKPNEGRKKNKRGRIQTHGKSK